MKNTQSGHNNNSNNNSHCVLYGVAGCTGELNPPQLGEEGHHPCGRDAFCQAYGKPLAEPTGEPEAKDAGPQRCLWL